MYYPEELLEEIRTQNDIVDVINEYLPLKQKGNSYFGLCPFHHEGTPSFSVAADKQFYYCFGCGAAGNVYSFIMQMENCDFIEAVKHLADRAHILLPEAAPTKEAKEAEELKNTLLEIHKTAGRFYYDQLQGDMGKKAFAYLNQRKVLPGIQRKFGLGYAPNGRDMLYRHLKEKAFSTEAILKSGLVIENKDKSGYHDRFFDRVMFPIFDVQGRVVGFGGRVLEKGEPKYLNSPETILFNKSKNLYGLNFAKASRNKELILVEGYLDMIGVYQAGYPNVVASLGTAFNQEHAKVLKKFATDIILFFDSDEAGTRAILRAIPVLVGNGFRVRVAQVPDGKDPDEFIQQNGPREFGKLLIEAKSYISFQINYSRKRYHMQNTEHKILFTTEAAEILAKIPSLIEQDVYIKEVSAYSGISPEAIQAEIAKIQNKEESDFIQEAEKKRKRNYEEGTVKVMQESKGLQEAQKELLFFCAEEKALYEKIREYLKPEDFLDSIYQRLAERIEILREKNQAVFAAELLNHFESVEEQKKVAEVFAAKRNYETRKDLEKAIQEEIRLVKTVKIDRMAEMAEDIDSIKKIVEEKKKLDEMNISITE